MQISLKYDAQALAAPQSFRDGVQAAANIIDSYFVDPITINITVGYGEIAGAPLGFNVLGEGTPLGFTLSYSAIRTTLASHATSPDDFQSVAFLPAGSSLAGISQFFIGSAQEKALGLFPAAATSNDGRIGLATSATGSLLIADALHELTHAMGRAVPETSFDLFRYTAAGVHTTTFFTSLASSSYFSINGGGSNLANFATSSDVGDWTNAPNDPFNATIGSTATPDLTAVDLTALDVLGFHRPQAAPSAPETSFDQVFYLSTNPDIAALHVDAQTHYDTFGWHEGRNPNAVFNTSFYLARYPDVARAGIDPLAHYEQFGWKEGRDPSPTFSTSHYLAVNPDVKLAGVDPLDHYILFGQAEHRPV
jgi:hypothetical protein